MSISVIILVVIVVISVVIVISRANQKSESNKALDEELKTYLADEPRRSSSPRQLSDLVSCFGDPLRCEMVQETDGSYRVLFDSVRTTLTFTTSDLDWNGDTDPLESGDAYWKTSDQDRWRAIFAEWLGLPLPPDVFLEGDEGGKLGCYDYGEVFDDSGKKWRLYTVSCGYDDEKSLIILLNINVGIAKLWMGCAKICWPDAFCGLYGWLGELKSKAYLLKEETQGVLATSPLALVAKQCQSAVLYKGGVVFVRQDEFKDDELVLCHQPSFGASEKVLYAFNANNAYLQVCDATDEVFLLTTDYEYDDEDEYDSSDENSFLYIWNLQTGKQVDVLTDFQPVVLDGFQVSPDGQRLAAGDETHGYEQVSIYDRQLQKLQTFDVPKFEFLIKWEGSKIWSSVMMGDATYQLNIWDVELGEMTVYPIEQYPCPEGISLCAFEDYGLTFKSDQGTAFWPYTAMDCFSFLPSFDTFYGGKWLANRYISIGTHNITLVDALTGMSWTVLDDLSELEYELCFFEDIQEDTVLVYGTDEMLYMAQIALPQQQVIEAPERGSAW